MSKPKPKTPVVPTELVEWLASRFPDRCPDVNDSDRKVWIDAGAAKVVRFLRKESERQQANALTQEITS